MDVKSAPLCLDSPVRFRDRWEGRLFAFEVDEAWMVINLVIKRGLLRTEMVKLPFSGAPDWSEDHVSVDLTSEGAFGRQLPPVAAPGLLLSRDLPLPAGGAHVAGAIVERGSRRMRRLLIRHGLGASRERVMAVEQLSFEGGSLRLGAQIESLPIYRSDEGLRSLVRAALAGHPYLGASDRRAITVEVSDGIVCLAGNVRKAQARAWAEQAAASVDGTTSLRSQIVDDIHLEVALAQALDKAGLLRSAEVYPRSLLGEVTLFGHASSARVAEDVHRVALRVPGVRSVTARLELRW